MSGHHQASAGAQLCRQARSQPGDRRPDLGHDLAHAGLGGQRVFDQGDVDVVGEHPLGNEGLRFLLVPLPVTAVEEGQRRPALSPGVEEVQPLARAAAIGQVPGDPGRGVQRQAAPVPVGLDFGKTGCDGAVVVGGVELGLRKVPVDLAHARTSPSTATALISISAPGRIRPATCTPVAAG